MRVGATVANALWLASQQASARRFARALRDPAAVQAQWLAGQLARHAASAFGRAHDFAAMGSIGDYVRQVPLSSYDDVAPSLPRIMQGEEGVLGSDRVSHLVPTSGSTGARKLIPFTSSLQRSFNAAVAPWMYDLARTRPALLLGPAYWSVSPLADDDVEAGAGGASAERDTPTVPVGFADDAEYLGAGAAWLVRQAMAAPSSLRFVRQPAHFWALTLLALLRQRHLRLLSVWHPSFLELLVSSAADHWRDLVESVATGACPWNASLPPRERARWMVAGDPARADALRRLGPDDWPRWWPFLQVVSCWGEQAAEPGFRALARRLPHVLVQAKGLLATEGVITIPYHGTYPLAVTSHFFEFLPDDGNPRLAHELERGAHYEVVVTNGAGLWRYRLGDVVECTGFLQATPTLRFLGRSGRVSDLRGEKLSEPVVAEALRALWTADDVPAYAALQAWHGPHGAGYELLVSIEDADTRRHLGEALDRLLCQNPHYAIARRLGQLQPIRVVAVDSQRARQDIESHGGRMGERKPRVLLDA